MSKYAGWFIGVAIFLTGAVVGGLAVQAWHMGRGPMPPRPDGKGVSHMIVERMEHDLTLSKEQKAALIPIVDEMVTRIHEARKPFKAEEENIISEYQAKMRPLLTPEQARKHEEIIQRMKKFRDSFIGPPPPPPGGPGGHDGPPPFGPPPFGPGGPGGPPPGPGPKY